MAPTRLLFYVSGHGFGHATRICALIAALRARTGSALEIEIRSEAPEWIFRERDPELRAELGESSQVFAEGNGYDRTARGITTVVNYHVHPYPYPVQNKNSQSRKQTKRNFPYLRS